MKTIFSLLLVCLVVATHAQTPTPTITKDLRAFDKIVASPLIDVVLIKGEQESIRLEYQNVTPDKINIESKGKTLRLYLTDAKVVTSRKDGSWKEDTHWYTLYPGARIKAYVTYRQLRHVQIRGEQTLACANTIQGKKLKIKLFGQNKATLAGLEVDKLTVSLFGENRLDVAAGTADFQKYRAFGDNTVYAENLRGAKVHTSLFGETLLDLNASERLNVNAFGESTVLNNGAGNLHKKITIGENTVRRK